MRNFLLSLLIWSLCFASVTSGTVLTYSWYKERGPVVKIIFQNASGLIPNQSKIIYRGVQVGTITRIRLENKDDGVVVVARMTKQASKLMGKDTKFWIVQPEFGLDKISNLSAIATGDYIAMEPVKGEFVSVYTGLKQPPADHPRLATGLRLILKTSDLGGVNDDSPILYRGLQVGNVWDTTLSKDKKTVEVVVFIYDEYRDLIRKNTYFSNISGLHANFSLFGGSKISMDSLGTLVRGGINIITPNLSGPIAKDGDVFPMLTAEQDQELQDS